MAQAHLRDLPRVLSSEYPDRDHDECCDLLVLWMGPHVLHRAALSCGSVPPPPSALKPCDHCGSSRLAYPGVQRTHYPPEAHIKNGNGIHFFLANAIVTHHVQ